MKTPRITVLMPVWNRAHLVRHSIQSIFDQSFKDWEFIAIDDGSDDNTWEILRKCQDAEPRFKPHRLARHMGLVEALKYGNGVAQGKIIVKHDSDDMSLPNRLEVIDNYFREF